MVYEPPEEIDVTNLCDAASGRPAYTAALPLVTVTTSPSATDFGR
jgi:hypothetical protein